MVRPSGGLWSEHTTWFGSSIWNRSEPHGMIRPPGSSYIGHLCGTGLPPAPSLALHSLPTHPRVPPEPPGAWAPSVSQLNQGTGRVLLTIKGCVPAMQSTRPTSMCAVSAFNQLRGTANTVLQTKGAHQKWARGV